MMRQLRIALAVMLSIGTAAHGQQGISPIAPQATFPTGSPATTNNDDSCDVALFPAATLLLPYFEVSIRDAAGVVVPANNAINTNFTITNVSQFPQVAHITIWTDRSFPVLDFNIYLTGYDVQGINLYDVIVRGQIPPTGSGTAATANVNSPVGSRSLTRDANPNFMQPPSAFFAACSFLGGGIPGTPVAGSTTATGLLKDVQDALTIGTYSTCPTATRNTVGSNRGALAVARGYVTVDVANTCSQTPPTAATYYGNELLFDNVLTGDYVFINPNAATGNYATSSAMVHIRAIPEGGAATSTAVVNFPYTFYDRYTPAGNKRADRRQPLPGTFAARFIQGGTLSTNLNIWREGTTVGDTGATCAVAVNSAIPITEIVRFDEHENSSTFVCPPPPNACAVSTLPSTSRSQTSDFNFPQLTSPAGDIGGWMYLNLNNGSTVYGNARGAGAPYAGVSQNWVIVQTLIEGRLGGDFEAIALGNGCSPAPAAGAVIGPAANTNP